MNSQVTRNKDSDWQPLLEEGVDARGIAVKQLRRDSSGRPPTFLLRFDPGASYPEHNHPDGEEAFVLSGEVHFDSIHLREGDYLYTAPGQTHAVRSEKGCELLFMVPTEVEILR